MKSRVIPLFPDSDSDSCDNDDNYKEKNVLGNIRISSERIQKKPSQLKQSLDAERIHSRMHLDSLFAQDMLESSPRSYNIYKSRNASLQHQDNEAMKKVYSTVVARFIGLDSFTKFATSLLTVRYSTVQAYKGEAYMGICVVALFVPNTRYASPRAYPLFALIDATNRVLCHGQLDKQTKLQLSREKHQHVSVYVPSYGGKWLFMYRAFEEAVEFVVAARTIAHFHEGIDEEVGEREADIVCRVKKNSVSDIFSSVQVGAEVHSDNATPAQRVVKAGRAAFFGLNLWLLERIGGTCYYTIGRVVEAIPVEAPREVLVGQGLWMAGLDDGVVGMCEGDVRLFFLIPDQTHVRQSFANRVWSTNDTVVAYVTCTEVRDNDLTARNNIKEVKESQSIAAGDDTPLQHISTMMQTAGGGSYNISSTSGSGGGNVSLPWDLVQLVLASLGKSTINSGASHAADGVNAEIASNTLDVLRRVERAAEHIQLQLTNLNGKLDRMDMSTKLEENNTAVERIVKRALGLLPQRDIDVEDVGKDRDALLASLEKYKNMFKEASENYQQALSCTGRYMDRIRSLENDLCIQKEALETRLRDAEEHRRLAMVELGVNYRETLEQKCLEKYDEGKAAGFLDGLRQGKLQEQQAANSVDLEGWKEKCFQLEQEALRSQSALQEAQEQHIRERRLLQSEVDSLSMLCERLVKKKREDYGITIPEATVEHQCKRIKRVLNAVYSNVERQLLSQCAGPEDMDKSALAATLVLGDSERSVLSMISPEDALSALFIAIKEEIKVFTQEIKSEAALREKENFILHQIRQEQRSALEVALPANAVISARNSTATNENRGENRRHALDDNFTTGDFKIEGGDKERSLPHIAPARSGNSKLENSSYLLNVELPFPSKGDELEEGFCTTSVGGENKTYEPVPVDKSVLTLSAMQEDTTLFQTSEKCEDFIEGYVRESPAVISLAKEYAPLLSNTRFPTTKVFPMSPPPSTIATIGTAIRFEDEIARADGSNSAVSPSTPPRRIAICLDKVILTEVHGDCCDPAVSPPPSPSSVRSLLSVQPP